MVAGEGAGMVVLEELEKAQQRGAKIYAEMWGTGSSNVADRNLHGNCKAALANALRAALRDAAKTAEDVGHINAHGLGTVQRDIDEADALAEVFGPRLDETPLTAIKSYFGNLGAASGVVELIASVLALQHASLPRVLNYETPDPACGVAAVTEEGVSPGDSFVSLSVTPQGQASVLLVGRGEG